jgi:serine/threonine-protein kinase HipA
MVDGWQAHFTACGVSPRDLQDLAEQVDRPYLRAEREAVL